jgi:hypothetical protein
MKMILAACLLGLTGCGLTDTAGSALVTGPVIASVATIQRTPVDAVYSWITGRDCSVVRLDQGKTYCRPTEPLPAPQPYCTRSLARVDCWADPATVPGHPRGVADGPSMLTAEQEANRVRTWP